MGTRIWGSLLACGLAAGCAAAPAASRGPDFKFAEALRMTDGLVNVLVGIEDVGDPGLVMAYADCVASSYALNQGFAFARHVRTTLTEESGVWLGDAVYSISPALPEGLRTIDAETTVAACGESGIPTV